MTPTLPGYQIGSKIYEGERTLVYQGTRLSDSLNVVIKLLRNSYPSFSELVQFRNQYSITKNLNSTGIVVPLSLERYGNGYALVMPEEGAIALDKAIAKEQSLDLGHYLDIAIQLAEILQELDCQRVIHKDIKPANILIQPETKQVKLIDFSIASLLPREAQEIKNFNVLEGTLAYIAPEQTGRMNRGIDYRSDFYSLGVTLYQLLTGILPFTSNDPIELVHCHISQPPIPPAEVKNNALNLSIPSVVSDLVMKLMAKNAEERYQSALGLKFDLETCLKQWQETGKIETFELATRDIAGRFLIPEKLYGREAEVETLLAAFERVAQSSPTADSRLPTPHSEMMLVAGFSGIGKTAVVNEIHKPIVREQGYFIKGKFDQFQRNIPFSALVIAFRDLMEQLLAESDAQLAQWQSKILAALGENGQVIIEVIPELERIIGKQPPVPELSGSAAQSRFNLLFQKFIQVFTTPEHPLVIFLDDLQWADSASLKLMQLLMGESETGYLLLLGAYRDNEVYPAHPLMLTLEGIVKSGASINTITLAPLSQADLNDLVADTLSCSQKLAGPLSELVYQKTKGNPFFATQFLKGLHEDGLIAFDRDKGYWHCDLTEVRQLALTEDVVEFMASRLHKLPEETQEVLKLAACIGNQFDLEALAIVRELEQIEVASSLWKALQDGLVLPKGETYKFFQGSEGEEKVKVSEISVAYKFLHDRVQQAAYSLIPDDRKERTHYRIGKRLEGIIAPEEREERIFELVNQLNHGKNSIADPQERYELARLNLIASRKARTATAYESGREYVSIGLSLLGENPWREQYVMTLAFHDLGAELASLCNDREAMNKFIKKVIKWVDNPSDKVNIYQTKIQALINHSQLNEAIELGLELLQEFNVTFPERPKEKDIQESIEAIKQAIAERDIEDLIHIPKMRDPEKIAIVRLATSVTSAASISGSPLFPLIVSLAVKLSIEYGNTPASAFAYATYGMVCTNLLQDVNIAVKFGRLALKVAIEPEAKIIKSSVLTILGLFLFHRTSHTQKTLPLLQEGYTSGLETGNQEYAGHNVHSFCWNYFLCGQSLVSLEQQTRLYYNELIKFSQLTSANYCRIHLQAISHLLYGAENQSILSGQFIEENEILSQLIPASDLVGLWYFYIHKLIICYLFADINSALKNATEAKKYAIAGAGMASEPAFYFYHCLSIIATVSSHLESESAAWQQLEENQKTLQQQWARHAPMNHQHKWDLIEAEKYRVCGKYYEAGDWYDRAIAGAKENEYLQEEALANELAAKFYLDWGKEKVAAGYMTDAYYCYARWGAKAKTDQLEEKYPQLLASMLQQPRLELQSGQTAIATHTLTQTSSSSTSTISSMLDWATAIKASQCLSSEMHLDKLVSTLMTVAMENAGADSGILLLQQPSGWQVVARYSQEGGDWSSTEVSTERSIPTSVINKVKRTQEAIIINDFPDDTQFAGDSYLRQKQPLSFLCAPILNQGKLIGILYLENHLAVGAFTRERMELLNMLCSQAAISMENARLYKQSQDYAQKLEQSLEDLQQAQLQLVQSEKMSALGNLVAGVAHEINNPVGFIAGNIEPARDYVQDLLELINLYQQEYPEPSEAIEEEIEAMDLEFVRSDLLELISSMRSGTDRIRHISNSLRTFSRTDKEYKVPFNLHEGLESTLLILKHRLKANEERPAIEIIKDYGQLPQVQCFPGQLNQVFMNLIANAIDALDEGNQGRSFDEIANQIKITTSATTQEVTIRIADNGTGMPEEVRERIFEQGFTTKAVGKGTGLGMAISKSIIAQKHSGKITCTSQLGKGTELEICLPIN